MGAIVVTGAARGIGRACVDALADLGTLLLVDMRDEMLASVAKELPFPVETLGCDLTHPSAIQQLATRVEKLGGLRALAHAAGLIPPLLAGIVYAMFMRPKFHDQD